MKYTKLISEKEFYSQYLDFIHSKHNGHKLSSGVNINEYRIKFKKSSYEQICNIILEILDKNVCFECVCFIEDGWLSIRTNKDYHNNYYSDILDAAMNEVSMFFENIKEPDGFYILKKHEIYKSWGYKEEYNLIKNKLSEFISQDEFVLLNRYVYGVDQSGILIKVYTEEHAIMTKLII